MEVELKPGKYVVAVSGGVDSVSLLHLLTATYHLPPTKRTGSRFVVAHFDHGIRPDSEADRRFVQNLAETYGLPFEYKREELGENASEALARKRRYKFLREVKTKHRADAIITAHHQDDVLETACINLLRGTGRKGLASLGSDGEVIRPLLTASKAEILAYAKKEGLVWREDPTNQSGRYQRNLIRKILHGADPAIKTRLYGLIRETNERNLEIDRLLEVVLRSGLDPGSGTFSRQFFISLPHEVAKELLAHWLRQEAIAFDRPALERLTAGLKTARAGARLDIAGGAFFRLGNKQISLEGVCSV